MSTSAVPVLGTPGENVDLLIRQGATLGPHRVTLTNPDGSAVDLTGATVRGQLRRKALDAGAPLATLTVTMVDEPGGVFEFGLTDEQTAVLGAGEDPRSLLSRAQWDMELQDAAGRVTPLFWGAVTIFREVTRS